MLGLDFLTLKSCVKKEVSPGQESHPGLYWLLRTGLATTSRDVLKQGVLKPSHLKMNYKVLKYLNTDTP